LLWIEKKEEKEKKKGRLVKRKPSKRYLKSINKKRKILQSERYSAKMRRMKQQTKQRKKYIQS